MTRAAQPRTRTLYAPFWLGDAHDLPGYSGGAYGVRDVAALARTFRKACQGEPFRLKLLVDAEARKAIEDALEVPEWGPMSSAEESVERAATRRDLNCVELVDFEGWGVGGWSAVLELFRPSLEWEPGETRRVAVGLDTIAVGDCRWLWEAEIGDVAVPMDPFETSTVCDAVISWSRRGAELIWAEFLRSREEHDPQTGQRMPRHLYGGKPSEMALIRDLWERGGRRAGYSPGDGVGGVRSFEGINVLRSRSLESWAAPDVLSAIEHFDAGSRLASYKAHVATGKRALRDVDVVYFHGRPKPGNLAPNAPGVEGELARIWRGRVTSLRDPTRQLVVCLWRDENCSVPRYGLEHVARLAKNLARHAPGVKLIVLVDDHFGDLVDDRWDEFGVEPCFLRFQTKLPGYLRILEAFRPDLYLFDDDVEREIRVLTGLDTVFMRDSRWLWDQFEVATRSPYLALPLWPWLRRATDPHFSNALVAYDEGGRRAMWQAVEDLGDPSKINGGGSGSEMDVMRAVHKRLGSAVLGSPDSIVSYPMQISPPSEKWVAANYDPVRDPSARYPPSNYEARKLRVGSYDHALLERATAVYFHEEPKQDTLPPDDPVRVEWERE